MSSLGRTPSLALLLLAHPCTAQHIEQSVIDVGDSDGTVTYAVHTMATTTTHGHNTDSAATPDRFVFDAARAQSYYTNGPIKFVPAFHDMHRMIAQLLDEKVTETGRILVVGAGGGLELKAFTDHSPHWHFTGVDPAAAMLEQAKQFISAEASGRVEWVNGVVSDVVSEPVFDAATCLLTLQLLRDDGTKLNTLRDIRARLKPGAPLIVVDQCIDFSAADIEVVLGRYTQWPINNGVPRDTAVLARGAIQKMATMVSPAREEALLAEASFTGIKLFYCGFAWRGYVCYA